MRYRGFTNPQTTEEYVVNNLCYFRQQVLALTQQELASKLSLKRSTLGAYEEGRATPPIKTVQAMCQLFGVSMDSFLTTAYRA